MSLALAAVHCERFFGADWYWNPERWGTVDGYAPWMVVLAAWSSVASISAWERLSMMRAIDLAILHSDSKPAALQQEMRIAYPPDEPDA